MDTEQVIASLSGLDVAGVAMVAATCVGLLGQAGSEEGGTAFESAVRTVGGQGEDAQRDLNAGGRAIYYVVNDLDDQDFDFDVIDDDTDNEADDTAD